MVPNLTARPLCSPVYLNRTCANSANSAILIIKMLEMIGIMPKLHIYHRLVEKYEYLFYFIYIYIFLLFKMTGGSASYDRTSLKFKVLYLSLSQKQRRPLFQTVTTQHCFIWLKLQHLK